MTSPHEPLPPNPDDSSRSEELPQIEDAYARDEDAERPPEEDDVQLLDAAARALEADSKADAALEETPSAASARVQQDEASDTGEVDTDEGAADEELAAPKEVNWDTERSAHRLIVELKRVEGEVRDLLADRDPKRKRKLAGTRRWLELEEDVIAWRYADRFDEETLRRLNELVVRRHHLFRRLRFLATTRPTWNT